MTELIVRTVLLRELNSLIGRDANRHMCAFKEAPEVLCFPHVPCMAKRK